MNYISPITQDKTFEHLLTALPLPICLLDKKRMYLFQNKAFEYLRGKTTRFIIGNICKLSNAAANGDLRDGIDRISAGSPHETLYCSTIGAEEPLWVTLTPGVNIGDVMVTVLRPDLLTLDESVLENRLRQLFELTAMEAKCAVLLTQGSSAQEIAAKRGVSLPTIRTQLKAIREKMGVKTSLAIAAKVSKLSLPLCSLAEL